VLGYATTYLPDFISFQVVVSCEGWVKGFLITMLIMTKQVDPAPLPPQFLFYSHIHNHAWCNLHVIIHPLLISMFYMICGLKKISTPPAQHGFSSTQQWWETV
jgi:hypothetical protein